MVAGRQDDAPDGLTELAAKVRELSSARWGTQRDTTLAGLHPRMLEVQHRMLICAQADAPVLISGETGTGKELFARAMHLLSRRRAAPYLCVNCAQYQDGQLIASELFGHRKGSFTGAVSDHRGIFEEADGGIVFLDEIAEMSPVAQAMLLRAIGESEILPVGDNRPRAVNVRVFAATSRDLPTQIARGLFREDLYYRLRYLQVRVPPLRDRGDDWQIIAAGVLRALALSAGSAKQLTPDAVQMLRAHRWPGNIRELRGVIETAFHISDSQFISASHLAEELSAYAVVDAPPVAPPSLFMLPTAARSRPTPGAGVPFVEGNNVQSLYHSMVVERNSFWSVVYEPFMARDLTRREARAIVEQGLFEARGSYKRLLSMFGIEGTDYLRFMDFLRHHRLKPSRMSDQVTDPGIALTRSEHSPDVFPSEP